MVLPTLNEELIDASLQRLTRHLLRIEGRRFEILLVDDSAEDRRQALRECVSSYAHLAPRVEMRVIEGWRRGKGHAVKLGARSARGEVVFVIDADLPVSLDHIDAFLSLFDDDANDMVIGARPLTRDFSRPVRLALSRVLALLVQAVIFQRATLFDTQCGFKAFRGATLRSLAEKQTVDGGMYDVEYLYVAALEERRVVRVPVLPEPETRPSKINVLKCIYTDPLALLRIKARGVRGLYGRRPARSS
ncbi:MAG TPA: glycosyltransferase [Polyangiaceae bacterium]|nr:glycosyltransferase [Polyangiaceae bacterium]